MLWAMVKFAKGTRRKAAAFALHPDDERPDPKSTGWAKKIGGEREFCKQARLYNYAEGDLGVVRVSR
jgi:hypothetical protein